MGMINKVCIRSELLYKRNKGTINKLKQLVEKVYYYTIYISITKDDLFDRYEYKLKQVVGDNVLISDDMIKNEICKDILFDLVFNVNGIKNQLLNDLYGDLFDEGDMIYIKGIYNDLKRFGIDIYIEDLEK